MSDTDTLAQLLALPFEKLAELSKAAAAEQGVDLEPALILWREAIRMGAMKEAEAVDKFVALLADNIKDFGEHKVVP